MTNSKKLIDFVGKEYCKEFYGHSDDMYSVPYADFNLITWLHERGYLNMETIKQALGGDNDQTK